MSEGPWPENWADAARWLLGAVFVFAAGFEGYVMLWDGRTIAGMISIIIAFILTAILVRWKHIEALAGTQFSEVARRTVIHPATWIATFLAVLLMIAFSPFVETRSNPAWSIGIAAGLSMFLLVVVFGIWNGKATARSRALVSRVKKLEEQATNHAERALRLEMKVASNNQQTRMQYDILIDALRARDAEAIIKEADKTVRSLGKNF